MIKGEIGRVEWRGLIFVKISNGDWRIIDPRTGVVSGMIKERNLEAVAKAMVSGGVIR